MLALSELKNPKEEIARRKAIVNTGEAAARE
jgi:hypothetical protein